MNDLTIGAPPYSVGQLIALPHDDLHMLLGEIPIGDLRFDEQTRDETLRTWLWLRGIATDSEDQVLSRARSEVLADGGLFVALNLPAAEFAEWFRREDWSCFDETERSGSDAWAWELLWRARAAYEQMGMFATQQPVTNGAVRKRRALPCADR
jgi:hypothetical protein